MSLTLLLSVSLLAASPEVVEVAAATELAEDPRAAVETAIVVARVGVEDAWLELTHLASELPPVFVDLGALEAATEPLVFYPPLPPGPTMTCSAGRGYGVACEVVYRGAGEYVAPPAVEVEFAAGLEVRGAYLQDLDPVVGGRVSVVPAELEAFRAYTMPLAQSGRRVQREVPTGADGAFVVPEVAPGTYFLETVLPSGRVHRSDPFTVPDRDTLRRDFEVDTRAARGAGMFWSLGTIEVPTGLDMELRALDPTGDPVPGASVAARQGRTPREVVNFESTSDAEGRARLHGLDVEMPVLLTCEKEGYRPFVEEYELLPVALDCLLQPWARIRGEVIDPGGAAPRGATVAVRPAGSGDEPDAVAVAYDGTFTLGELAAGDYELWAAAPGFRVEERTFTVDFGQDLDLGPILLLFAREIDGTVVDAETGEPLAGIDIRSLSPPGAVDTFSEVDGTFAFGLDGSEPLVVEFSTFDYAARQIRLDPERIERRDPLVVELVAAGWIMAEVATAEGGACQGCRVVIWPGGEEMWTDARGEALSGPLAAGTYRVARPRVTHLGSTVVEQPDAEMVRVRVRPGRLSVARLATPGREVRVRFRSALDGIWMLSARSRARTEKRFAESDGAFRFQQRPGESLDLFLHTFDEKMGGELAVWQATLPGAFLSEELALELSGSLVHGRALTRDGALAGAEVRLVHFADASLKALTYTHSDGTFRVPHVRPGVYNLYVGPRSVKFLSVGSRQTVDLGTFELMSGASDPRQTIPGLPR